MKKLIPYILILIIFVGLLGPSEKARAQTPPPVEPMGTCTEAYDNGGVINYRDVGKMTEKQCNDKGGNFSWTKEGETPPQTGTTNNSKGTAFQQIVDESCGISSLMGCVVWFFYVIYYAIPAFFLWLIAYIFNVLIYISLGGAESSLFSGSFVLDAWGIVRDLSNIFFIFILLYAAIEMILDLGHGAKQTIGKVIIAAMLINFSMFFTEVIIDSSNMLALVFYNKMTTMTKNSNGETINYVAARGEHDIAGAMVANFDPTTAMSPEFFSALKQVFAKKPSSGEIIKTKEEGKVPIPLTIAILIFSGSLLYYVAIVLAIASFAFLMRIIELWVLIIFSPFAFMSSTIPKLAGREWIGWTDWFHRLIKTAFMAPIFMFFLYFIFKLIKSNIFKSIIPAPSLAANEVTAATVITYLLSIALPLIFIEVLLYKAMKYAVSSSGKVGEAIMTGMKALGGLALGAVSGGTALVATKAIGGTASQIMKNKGEEWKERAAKGGAGGFMAKMALKATDKTSKASFDVRNTGVGKSFAKTSGLNLSSNMVGLGPKEGGYKGAGERKAAELKKESELYKTSKTDAEIKAENEGKTKEYDAAKAKAREKDGNKFNEEAFEKENGKRPPQTAAEVDGRRMMAFQESLIKNSLSGILAKKIAKDFEINSGNYDKSERYKREFAKKHGASAPLIYDESVAKSTNDSHVKTARMWVGGGISAAGEGTFAKEVEKTKKEMENVTKRLETLGDTLKNQEKILTEGKQEGFLDEKGNVTDKLIDTIEELKITQEDKKGDITAIRKQLKELPPPQPGIIDLKRAGLEKQLTSLTAETIQSSRNLSKYESMKSVKKDIENTYDQMDKVNTKKKGIVDSSKPKGGGSHPPPAAPAAPKHEEHPPAPAAGGGAHPPAH